MAGSNIFVMYTSADGKNVTVSPRIGKGNYEPLHDTAAKITILEGSGVQNGVMTANVQCSNCGSWNGGSMDFTSASASWIYAYKSGSALNSDSLTESINQHDAAAAFSWPISAAKGGKDVNPFVAAGGSNGGSTGAVGSAAPAPTIPRTVSGIVIPATCTPIATSGAASASGTAASATSGASTTTDGTCPTAFPPSFTGRPTWPASCFTGAPGPHPTGPPTVKRNDGCPAGYASTNNAISAGNLTSSTGPSPNLILAHGVIACIAFVALFPIGGILIRVASFSGLLWVHAALQSVAFLFYIVAFGMGVYIATSTNLINNPHSIIGIVLLIILVFQPVLGILHHKLFKKYGTRTLWSYFHIWHGRAAIILGMINGGLGIRLAGPASSAQKIAYGVVAAIMGVAYIGAIIYGELKRRKKQPPADEKSERGLQRRQSHQLQDLSSSEENVRNQGYYGKESQRV